MTKYLAGVLSVIAVGVLLIAYGLLTPRTGMDVSAAMSPVVRPGPMSEPVATREPLYGGNAGYAYVPIAQTGYASQNPPATYAPVVYVPQAVSGGPAVYPQPLAQAPRAVRTVSYEPETPRRQATPRYVERRPRRDWKRTALIVGGSSATGAGVGAIFGGKKGALIGAAIAGGASTIYQTVK